MGIRMTPDDHAKIWKLVEAGESYASIERMIGRRLTTVRDWALRNKCAESPAKDHRPETGVSVTTVRTREALHRNQPNPVPAQDVSRTIVRFTTSISAAQSACWIWAKIDESSAPRNRACFLGDGETRCRPPIVTISGPPSRRIPAHPARSIITRLASLQAADVC